MRFSALRLLCLWLCLASVSRLAFAEHELPTNAHQEEEEGEPGLRTQPSAQTLRDIRDTISRTDPRTLEALKETLADIAQGKTVSGPMGQVALDFLEQIPAADIAVPPPQPGSEPEATKGSTLPPINANGGAANQATPAGTPSTTVRIEASVPQLGGEGQNSILRVAESAGPGGAVFRAFPYSSATGDEAGQEEASPEAARERRKARAVSEAGIGGSELPSGQGGVASNDSPTIRAGKSFKGAIPESKQRLAGTVTSLLEQFQRRAPASVGQRLADARPGVFERLAMSGGFTVERALAKAAISPAYRKFQSATLEAGMTPSESLGAYYAVLALAWLGTIGFLLYCLKFTPLGPRLRSFVARSRR